MDYVTAGNVITNTVVFPDGSMKEDLIGGSGLYALAGVRLWTKNCLLVANVGKDFYSKYGDWFRDNELSMDGIRLKSDYSAYQILRYHPNGVYDIDHRFGAQFEISNYSYLRATPEDALSRSEGSKGVYFQFHTDTVFLEKMIEGKKQQGFRLMWEYLPSESIRDPLPTARELLRDIDIFSINYPESCGMFGTEDEAEIIESMKSLKIPLILFRVGEKGLYTIAEGRHWFVPSVGSETAVDPTGCGNCSTGASLYAFCEGYDPLMIGVMANVAAAYNVRQYGPYPLFDEKARLEALKMSEELYRELKNRD